MTAPVAFRLLADEEIALRLLEEDHAEAVFAITESCRAYLRRWLPWVDDTRSVNDMRRFIRMGLRQWRQNSALNAGIWYHGAIVGVISYNYINWERGVTELGYWLAESYQGRGVMTRACRAMIDHAFNTMNLRRVEIRCAVENQRSRAVPERLGFIADTTLPRYEWLYDRYVDALSYRMLAEDWRAREEDQP